MTVLEGSGSSKKVQEVPKRFKKFKKVKEVQKCPNTKFNKVQDGLRRFNMVHVCSIRCEKVKKGQSRRLKRFKKVQDG